MERPDSRAPGGILGGPPQFDDGTVPSPMERLVSQRGAAPAFPAGNFSPPGTRNQVDRRRTIVSP